MAKPRYLQAGSHHHLYFRGIDGEAVFRDTHDKRNFLQLWRKYADSSELVSLSHALLSTHAHIFVGAQVSAVSRIMHRVLGTYAQWFNRKWGRSGDLFESRFKSKPVVSGHHARVLVRYILLNPVESGLCSLPQLAEFPWTNLPDLLGKRAWQRECEVAEALDLFSVNGDSKKVLMAWLSSKRALPSVTQRCYEVCVRHHLSGKELRSSSAVVGAHHARRELAHILSAEFGWSSSKIARYLRCSQRTVQRFLHHP